MEQFLLKLARQLEALDEASLMALWADYANKVSHFEPTKRWEEAALILSLIQAKRWKNQLFNYQWASQVRPQHADAPNDFDFNLEKFTLEPPTEAVVEDHAVQIDFNTRREIENDEKKEV